MYKNVLTNHTVDYTVLIDIHSITNDNFQGLGIEWDPYCYYSLTDSEMEIVKSRVNYLKPSFIRCGYFAFWYCNGFDESGNPIYDFSSYLMQYLYKILDYCQEHNINVLLCEWMAPAYTGTASISRLDILKTYHLTPSDPRWSKIIVGMLDYLINIKGYSCIYGFNYINEPNGEWNHCTYEDWKTGVGYLKAELDVSGLSNIIKISGPDSFGAFDTWLISATSDLSHIMGQYDAHWYATSEEVYNGNVEASLKYYRKMINVNDQEGTRKDFIIAEAGICEPRSGAGDQQLYVKDFWYGVSMADYAVQTMRAGVSGISGWGLDDASWINCGIDPDTGVYYEGLAESMPSSYVSADHHPDIPTRYTLKVWGFWNSLGYRMEDSSDTNIRPWFYPWSLISRLIPRHSKILSTDHTGVSGLRTVAAKIANGHDYEMTFVVVNNSDKARTIIIKVPDATKRVNLKQYNYFINDRPININGFPVEKQILSNIELSHGIDINLPSRGVVIYTTL